MNVLLFWTRLRLRRVTRLDSEKHKVRETSASSLKVQQLDRATGSPRGQRRREPARGAKGRGKFGFHSASRNRFHIPLVSVHNPQRQQPAGARLRQPVT